MKLKVKKDGTILFIPETEIDVFDLGKISTKAHPYSLGFSINKEVRKILGRSSGKKLRMLIKNETPDLHDICPFRWRRFPKK